MSPRAVLAHEYYGHAANAGTPVPPGMWNDEFRASYMDTKNNPNKITNEEASLLIKASEDFATTGTTSIECPRCGSKLMNDKFGNSSIIRCEKEGCLKLTLRGL